ncbi:MAG: Na+/H+ antiporter subunit E [Spirochaetales bacterium]|jgi:multicomponent Na+:H+ antiporter subunit E|nr:Na+/H+ antiporter subunit E [Spirochaetales bacterium]
MAPIKSRLTAGILLFAVWFLLMYPLSGQEAAAGIIISLILVFLPLPNLQVFSSIRFTPKAILYSVFFLFVFLWEVIKSNIDVALRVLKPVIPLKPGIVKVNTTLRSELGRLVLANAITLTPGTITVDITENQLYIHWIAVDADGVDQSTKKIVSHFEKYLEVIFG